MKVVDFALGDASRVAHGWTIAVLPEGYTQVELDAGLFDADVAKFVKRLLVTSPFNDAGLRPLLNVVKVRKASAHTGNTIHLITPTPTTSPFGTMFGAMFGRDTFQGHQIERIIFGDDAAVKKAVHDEPGLGPVNHFLVLINNTQTDGGCMSNEVGWFTKFRASWPDVAIHELGHQAFRLADEYPYRNDFSDPVSTHPGGDPTVPNVTTVTDVATMKWAEVLTLPQSQVPTTVRATPCVRNHPVIAANPPIPADAVGAYEGAQYHDCGVFRPSLQCRMRESTRPFCRVCEMTAHIDIGHYLVDVRAGSEYGAGAWTHVQSLAAGANPERMLSYNAATGAYAISAAATYRFPIRRPDGTPPIDSHDPAVGTGSLGAGWTWLAPFDFGGTLHYFGHQFGSGMQGIFAMDATFTSVSLTHATPPGHASHTHVVTLNLGGAPHYVGYNSLTGDAGLFRLDSDTADPVPVSTMQWGAGHTAVVAIMIGSEPYVMTYRMSTGELMIRHLTSSSFTMTFASPSGFWKRNITHVALLDLADRPYLVRYSSFDGSAAVHHVRDGGTGVDLVCRVPPLGPGALSIPDLGSAALSILGAGAPVMGRVQLPEPNSGRSPWLYIYNALKQTLNLTPVEAR
ncbi:M64 family metallopeptidase [Streptomyces sp. NBC_00009]|uniref:M64 family metallopeptidase n=1 Tax=Streptomyces sp. NBC_00009 TaxID=2975620 RepID=UPI003254E214